MSKSCVNLFYEFATLYMGRGGILETLLKITIILCQWLSEIYQKKKKNEKWGSMHAVYNNSNVL